MTGNYELQHKHDNNGTEPHITDWKVVSDAELQVLIEHYLPEGQQCLVLIDGHSGAGKTTFANKLATFADGQIIHVDDISWHLDIINWDREMVEGVIKPWQGGQAIAYKPPGWVKKGREGMVEAPASRVLIIEGVGAGRRSLSAMADLIVWVQSDGDVAFNRGIERDMEITDRAGKEEAVRFWHEWMETEVPFLNNEQPWTRAQLVVNGTPTEIDSGVTNIAPGPLVAM